MRKFLFWYLPITVAAGAAALFAAGFYGFLRGDLGRSVDEAPKRGVQASAPRGEIVPLILGDSLARGTGDESGLGIAGRVAEELVKRGVRVRPPVNLAINGARTGDLLRQLDSRNVRVLAAQSNVIIVSIGGNDLWGGTDWRTALPQNSFGVMDEVLARMERIVTILRGENASARIYLVGLYNPFVSTPSGAALSALVTQWNARLLQRFASDTNVVVVPVADVFAYRDRLSFDRFHPSTEGYAAIARRIAESM